MEYMLMFRETANEFSQRNDPIAAPAYWGAWNAYIGAMHGAGIVVNGNGLMPPDASTTLRVREGRRLNRRRRQCRPTRKNPARQTNASSWASLPRIVVLALGPKIDRRQLLRVMRCCQSKFDSARKTSEKPIVAKSSAVSSRRPDIEMVAPTKNTALAIHRLRTMFLALEC